MTSDAKIGLLLGLVFIFVIAFIINGLPNLKPQQATHADVPIVVGFPDQQGMGILGQARGEDAQDRTPANDGQEPIVASHSAVDQPAPVAAETSTPEAQVASNQDVRYETFLPGGNVAPQRSEDPQPRMDNAFARIGTLLNRFTAGTQGQTTSTFDMSSEQSATTVEPQPVVQTPQPRADVRPAEAVARAPEQATPAKTFATPKPIVGKIYTVGEGESLSTVAKNVYGPEEGNRYVNINRIYEANRDILKSRDEVIAGQKLIIPPLPKPTVNPNKPSDVLSQELFEKVETIAKRPASQTQTAVPAAGVPSRWYTVQDGDNLWKIASTQLGAGARYDEIAKLNTDLLKNGEKLDVGMKIRLPLK